ncbi:MAG: hypothetical protein IPJ43_20065 [Saprospiraceae bacterium]|nr:hypothetical protein [Saprospiraceae bacterium]
MDRIEVIKLMKKSLDEVVASLHSAKKIAEISESELYNISILDFKTHQIWNWSHRNKPPQGLSVESELKILRVIKD